MADTATAEPTTQTEDGQRPPQQTSIIPKGEMLEQINRADKGYKSAKETCRKVAQAIQDELDEMPAYQELKKAEEALAHAKENLRIASLSNANLNNLKEQLHEEKANRKLRLDVLSDLIVRYAADYRVKSVRTDEDIDDTYRELKLSGRMGRKLKQNVELQF